MYEFPFPVPTDLSTVGDDDLVALLSAVRQHAQTFTNQPASEDVVTALQACRDLARTVNTTLGLRRDAATLAADIDTTTTPPVIEPTVTPEPAPVDADPEGEPVTAAARTRNPTVAEIAARRAGSPDLPPEADRGVVTMQAATDFPGLFATGQTIGTFGEAIRALSEQIDRYPTMRESTISTGQKTSARTQIVGDDGTPRYEMRSYTRHGGVQFRREFPANLRVQHGADGFAVAQFAASERRLPGGSLVESMRRQIAAGRPITAAAGWCAPSEPIYDLCELSSLDGLLDVPELQTDRGGWQIPTGGGPAFATVWSGIGNSGTTHLTEGQVIAESPSKYCYDIPCPGFTDVRLGVDYFCLTGSLLQRRGYPEVVQWFGRQAMTALPHKINMGFIAAIVAASGAATVIPADPSGDDAISGLLSAIDLAITDAKYRNRMAFNGTLEVVLPMWTLVQLRAAGSRRNGVDLVGLTDAQIMEWFAIRQAAPRFVYDWQDAFSGLVTGPGGAAALTALPLTVNFLIYPAGTWVKAVQPVVSLDTVYDSTKLTTNEYTAMFVEDGWAALQMCPLSRLYTAPVDPSGVVGCCPVS